MQTILSFIDFSVQRIPKWIRFLTTGLAAAILILPLNQGRAATLNVAPRGVAYANRPLYAGWNIAGLNDGDLQGVLHADTQPGSGLAYTLDLGKDYAITSIRIYPRQDACCPERLSNFRVSLHHDNGQGAPGVELWGVDLFADGSNPGSGPGTMVNIPFPSPQQGRWVQIAARGDNPSNYALQMTELEVYANVPLSEYNLALHAPASANGPLYNGYTAAILTDGNWSGAGNRLVHGDTGLEPGFAYTINLETSIKLDKIVIWARQDGNNPERLSNYRVSVCTDNNGQIGSAVWKADLHVDGSNPGADPGSKDEITAGLDATGNFTGQWIQIESLDNPVPDYALQMTEVEVFGTPAATPNVFITRQPQDVSTGLGASGTFRVGVFVGGGDPDLPSYQWQLNGVSIAGATNDIYVTPPAGGSDDGNKYKCQVNYPGLTSLASTEAILRINVAYHTAAASNRKLYPAFLIGNLVDGNPGTLVHLDTSPAAGAAYTINLATEYQISKIVVWPRQDGCCAGRLSNFRVSVHKDNSSLIGGAVWQTNLFADGSNPGSTSGSKVEIAVDPQATGQWIQILSLEDPVQDYALQIGEVEVFGTSSSGAKLLITQQPQDAAIMVGNAAIFTVTASVPGGSPGKVQYQWLRNGVAIAGATNTTYRTPVLFEGDEGAKYQCQLSYPGLTTQATSEVTVRFNRALEADVFSSQPLWDGLELGALVDGNHSTYIHLDVAPEDGAAYTINLGEVVRLTGIDLWPRQDGCCPERFANVRISVHKDNNGQIGDAVWQADLYTDGSNPGSGPGHVIKLTAAKNPAGQFEGQWLRIQSLESPVQDYALQLSEVEVFGKLASSPVSSPALVIQRMGNQVKISWPAEPAGFVLQQNTGLAASGWTDAPGANTNPATIIISGSTQFLRLIKK